MANNSDNITAARTRLLNPAKVGSRYAHERTYSPDQYDVWIIYGEAGDFAPVKLDVVEGLYKHVVEYALQHPKFFNYGQGGRIEAQEKPTKQITAEYLGEMGVLQKERDELEKRLAEINAVLPPRK